jgi:hypothetical protein
VYTYHEKRHRLIERPEYVRIEIRMGGRMGVFVPPRAAWEELSGDTLGLDWTAVTELHGSRNRSRCR